MIQTNDAERTPYFELSDGRRFPGWEIARLAASGCVSPEQEIYFYDELGRKTACKAREMPNLPLSEMLEGFFGAVSVFVASTGSADGSLSELLRRGLRLRDWAPTPMSSFANRIDFGRAFVCHVGGLTSRAAELYQDVATANFGAGDPLLHDWVNHNLAVLELQRGRQRGLKRFVKFVPRRLNGPVCFNTAELIRFFLRQGLPSPEISGLLLHQRVVSAWAKGSSAARADVEDPHKWVGAYEAAAARFRELAITAPNDGLQDLARVKGGDGWLGAHRGNGADNPARGRLGDGMLMLLRCEEIPEDLAWADPELRLQSGVFRRRLRSARRLVRRQKFARAKTLVEGVIADTEGAKTMEGIRDEATFQQDELAHVHARSERQQQKRALRQVWRRFDELRAAPPEERAYLLEELRAFTAAGDLPREDWGPVVAAAEDYQKQHESKAERGQAAEWAEEVHQALLAKDYDRAEHVLTKLAVIDDPQTKALRGGLLDLSRRARAEEAFQAGLDEVDKDPAKAEALLTVAAGDPRFARLLPPLVLASHLLHGEARAPWRDLPGLGQYRGELLKRIAVLSEPGYCNGAVAGQVWDLIGEFTEKLVSCAPGRVVPLGPLVDTLCDRAEKFREVPETVERIAGLLERLKVIHPNEAMCDSAVSKGLQCVAVQRALLAGETERARPEPDLDAAAECFREAIGECPTHPDGWVRLADCRIAQRLPRRRHRIACLEEVRGRIAGLAEADLVAMAETADPWVQQQVEQFAAELGVAGGLPADAPPTDDFGDGAAEEGVVEEEGEGGSEGERKG